MAPGELGTCVDRSSQRTAALWSRDGVARGSQTLHLSALVSAFTERVSNFQNRPPTSSIITSTGQAFGTSFGTVLIIPIRGGTFGVIGSFKPHRPYYLWWHGRWGDDVVLLPGRTPPLSMGRGGIPGLANAPTFPHVFHECGVPNPGTPNPRGTQQFSHPRIGVPQIGDTELGGHWLR